MTDALYHDIVTAVTQEGSLTGLSDALQRTTGHGLLQTLGEPDLLDVLVTVVDEEEAISLLEPLASQESPLSSPGGCGA